MNRVLLNEIFGALSPGVISGYNEGLRSIVQLNRSVQRRNRKRGKFVQAVFASRSDSLLTINWTDADKDAVRNYLLEAFEMSGVGSWELEEALKEIGVKVQTAGALDYEGFELEVRRLMSEYGVGIGTQPPAGWIKQALDTAIKSSIQGARWIRINDPDVTELYPALMYKTQEDDAVRDEHRKFEGLVYRKEDAFWLLFYPPNDWGCRCYTEPVSIDEIGNYKVLKSTPETLEDFGKKVPQQFQRNPGVTKSIWRKWLDDKYRDMPAVEVQKLKELLKEYAEQLPI